ncbi:MAG: VOC family protein, partial [Myxococcales bacterium]|nr:VOC family protein [Myxococcales bacterium]
FTMSGGDGEAWAILVNGDTVIGLFQGMFEKNMLTFNPGWSGPGQSKEGFSDVRDLCKALEAAGIQPTSKQLDGDAGPGHITLEDPDGNPILIDQHV